MFSASQPQATSQSFGESLISRLRLYLQALPAPSPAQIQCPQCNYKLDILANPELLSDPNLAPPLKVTHFCMFCSATNPNWDNGVLDAKQPTLLLQMDPLDDDLLSQIDAMSSPSLSSMQTTPGSSLPVSQRSSYFEAL